jgi:hypothetical protein
MNADYDQLMWNVRIAKPQYYLMFLPLAGNIFKNTFCGDLDAR